MGLTQRGHKTFGSCVYTIIFSRPIERQSTVPIKKSHQWLRKARYRQDGVLTGRPNRCESSERAHRRTDAYVLAAQRSTWPTPSQETPSVQVRAYFRIEVYERPMHLTQYSLGLEAQRELLMGYTSREVRK